MMSMNQEELRLPPFRHRYCELLTVCVRAGDGSSESKRDDGKERWRVARYDAEGRTAFIRLGVGETKGHLHVDCAWESYFGEVGPPIAETPVEEIVGSLR